MSNTNFAHPTDEAAALTEVLRFLNAPVSGETDPPIPEFLRRAVIAGGEPGKVQIGRTIINISSSSDITIGGRTLDTEASALLRQAVFEASRSIELDRFGRALRDYFDAMRTFSNSFGYDLRYVFADHHSAHNLRQSTLSLDDVYVPLQYVSLKNEKPSDRPPSFAMELRDALDLGKEDGAALKILFEGLPGSGKSTILRQIVKYCWDDPTRLCLTERRIPVYVRLATLAQSSGGSIEEKLWSSIAADRLIEMNSPPPPGWFMEWPKIMASSFVLLLDGFDEVGSEKQTELRGWLDRVLRQNHDVVLTSRAISSVGLILAERFHCYRLIPFNDGQQRELARNWLHDDADAFLKELRRTQTSIVGRTPLLLTVAAFVYALEKRLPSGRTCLYDRFVSTWLGESQRRGIYHDLGSMAEYLREIVCFLALQMTEAPLNTSEPDLIDRLTTFFQNSMSRSGLEASSFARRFLRVSTKQTAVFSVSGGVCSWLHPTIREYLAAEAIVNAKKYSGAELGTYISKWNQESWQQVVIFLLAILSREQDVTALVSDIAQDNSIEAFLFVGAALIEGIRVDSRFVELVLTSIARLIVGEAETREKEDKSHGAQTLRMASQTALRLLANFGSEPIGSGYSKRLGVYLASLATQIKGAAPGAVDALVELGCFDDLVTLTKDAKAKTELRVRSAIALLSAAKRDCVVPELRPLLEEDLGSLSQKLLVLVGPCLSAQDIVLSLSGTPLPHSRAVTYLLAELLRRWGSDSVVRLIRDSSVDVLVAAEASEMLDDEVGDDEHPNFCAFLDSRLAKQESSSDSLKLREWLKKRQRWPQLARFVLSDHVPIEEAVAAIVNLEVAGHSKGLQLVFRSAPLGPLKFEAALALRTTQPEGSNLEELDQWAPAEIDQDPEALRRWASSLHKARQYEKAVSAYDKLIAMTGGDNLAFDNRGALFMLLDRNEDAIKDFTRALALEVDDSFALLWRGKCLWRVSRETEAIEDFRSAEKLGHMKDDFLQYFGDCYREIGDQIQAVSYLDKYVEYAPGDWRGYARRGLAYLDGGVPEKALADLTIAVDLEPASAWACRGLSHCYVLMDLMDKRYDLLKRMGALKPRSISMEFAYIKTLLCIGKVNEANAAVSNLTEKHPDSYACLYIEALCRFVSVKDIQQFKLEVDVAILAAEERIRINRQQDANFWSEKVNLTVFHAAIGNQELADHCLDELISHKQFHNENRFIVITALIELSILQPENSTPCTMLARVESTNTMMWPLIKSAQSFPDRNTSPLEPPKADVVIATVEVPLPNGAYPFPMYCRLSGIQGLSDVGHYCAAMLACLDNSIPTIALVTLETPDRVFGSCNFKAEFTDNHNFKFCDTYRTFLDRDVKLFVAALGPLRILLTESRLLERLESDAVDTGFGLSLRMVSVDSELLRKTNPRPFWEDNWKDQ